MFWADAVMNVIEKSDLNGRRRRVILWKANHYFGMTLTPTHV